MNDVMRTVFGRIQNRMNGPAMDRHPRINWGWLCPTKRATATIPILFQNAGDPVALGLTVSLSRPAGNVTGLTSMSVRAQLEADLQKHKAEWLQLRIAKAEGELMPVAQIKPSMSWPASR
jgi:ABC transporter substrate binding protein